MQIFLFEPTVLQSEEKQQAYLLIEGCLFLFLHVGQSSVYLHLSMLTQDVIKLGKVTLSFNYLINFLSFFFFHGALSYCTVNDCFYNLLYFSLCEEQKSA